MLGCAVVEGTMSKGLGSAEGCRVVRKEAAGQRRGHTGWGCGKEVGV